MAFMSMVFVLVAFIFLCIVGVGLVGLALIIAGFITGHENKKAVQKGYKSSNVHIILKVLGVLLTLPTIAILLFFMVQSVKAQKYDQASSTNIDTAVIGVQSDIYLI